MTLENVTNSNLNSFKIKKELKDKLNALIDQINTLDTSTISHIEKTDFRFRWNKRLLEKINEVIAYGEGKGNELISENEIRQKGKPVFLTKINAFIDAIDDDGEDRVKSSSSSSSESSSSSSDEYSESSSSSSGL